jgi:hypothetical protein
MSHLQRVKVDVAETSLRIAPTHSLLSGSRWFGRSVRTPDRKLEGQPIRLFALPIHVGVQFENYKLFFEPQNHDWLELSRIRMTHPGNFVDVISSVKCWESIRAVARNRLKRDRIV